MHKEHKGLYLAFLAVLCTSGIAVFIKLSSSASTASLVFARFAIGLPLFIWIAYRKKISLNWSDFKKNFLRSFSGIAALYTYYFALKTLPLVNTVTLVSTAPLFLPFLVLIYSKLVISKRRILALVIGFIGVIIVLRPSTSGFVVVASILGLVSGFLRAVALFNIRKLAKTESTIKILVYYFFIGSVLSFIPLFFDWKPIDRPIEWLYIVLSGVFALGYQYIFTKACSFTPATKVSSITYMNVIFGGLFGWLIFQEVPSIWVILGVVFIITGALLALTDKTESRPLKKRGD